MRKHKRKKELYRMMAVLLLLCMLPVSDFSGLVSAAAMTEESGAEAGTGEPEPRESGVTGPGLTMDPEATDVPESTAKPEEPLPAGEQPEERPLEEAVEPLILTSVRGEDGSLLLHWNLLPCGEEDLITYQIYRNTTLLDSLEGDSYTDILPEGEPAVYLVTAFSRQKQEVVAESNELTVLPHVENWVVEEAFTLGEDMTVESLTVKAELHLNGHKLTVKGDAAIAQRQALFIESGSLECGGDFYVGNSAHCYMEQEKDSVLVHGNFTAIAWYGDGFQNGTLEVKGDFSSQFFVGLLEGPFRVILSGERLQRVSPGETVFGLFELQNHSQEGVVLDRAVRAVEFRSNGCRVSFADGMEYRLGWTLYEDQKIEGDLKLLGETLDLNGHTLTVTGDLIQSGGILLVNGGRLLVEGNYHLTSDSGINYYTSYDNFGKLVMREAADYVRVEGDFVSCSAQSTEGLLTDGVLELKGKLLSGPARLYGKQVTNFYFSGRHRVLLSGSQSRLEGSYNMVVVENLELSSEREEGITITNTYAKGKVKTNGKRIAGRLTIQNSSQIEGGCYPGSLEIAGEIQKLVIEGDLHIAKDAHILGKVEVKGDFQNSEAFTMDSDEAYLKVEGSYYQSGFPNEFSNQLTAGVIEVKGDFQIKRSDFTASGRHRVILSGENKQNIINIGQRQLQFQTLELKNTGGGVDVAGPMEAAELVKHNTKLTYGGHELLKGQTLYKDTVIGQDVTLMEDLDLNGHCLTIKGELLHAAGRLSVNGGQLIVEGDYRQQTAVQKRYTVSSEQCHSSLIMQKKKDYVRIEGTFFTLREEAAEGLLTNGILELQGDFTCPKGKSFQTSGEHQLVFKSSHKQRVDVGDYDGNLVVGNLRMENSSEQGINITYSHFEITESLSGQGVIQGVPLLSPAAKLQGSYPGAIRVNQSGIIPGEWKVEGSLTVQSGITVSGQVTVGENLYVGGTRGGIRLNGGDLCVKGNAYFQTDCPSTSLLFSMSGENDYFGIEGGWYISCRGRVELSAGVTEVKGDLKGAVNNGLSVTMNGTHRLLLSGESKQTVLLDQGNSRIHILELKNTSEEGAYLVNSVPIDQIITNGCHLTNGGGPQRFGWKLQEDQIIDGDLCLLGNTLDLNGHQLTVKGNLIQGPSTIVIAGGRLIVEKDYRVQQVNHNHYYERTSGTLELCKPEDYVLVKGDYIDECRWGQYLSAGTLEIQGNFQNLSTQVWLSDSDVTVIFSGEQEQKTWSSSSETVISRLEIRDKNETAVEFRKGFIVRESLCSNGNRLLGTISIYGNAVLDNGKFEGNVQITEGEAMTHEQEITGELTVAAPLTLQSSLKVNGDVNVKGGSLTIGAGSLTVGRNLNLVKPSGDTAGNPEKNVLRLSDDRAFLSVEGNYKDESREKTLWEKGVTQIKGNVSISPTCKLEQKSGHKWILNGERGQVLDIGNLDTALSYLELQNRSGAGVDIATPIQIQTLIDNGCHVTYGGKEGRLGWTLEEDQEVKEGFTLIGGRLDLNGHTLTVKGSLNHLKGSIRINGGRLIVEGDYNLENKGTSCWRGESAGTLEMSNANDYVLVKNSMYIQSQKDAVNTLTDGTLELQGSFIQSNSYPTFLCSGNHTVILSGNQSREISAVHGFQNLVNRSGEDILYIRDLSIGGTLSDEAQNFYPNYMAVIQDPNQIDDYGFSGSLRIKNKLTCTRDLQVKGTVELHADMDLNGHTVTAGNFEVDQGDLILNGGAVKCRGNLLLLAESRIIMNRPEDSLLVEGGLIYYCRRTSILSAGTMELRGLFADHSNSGFRAGGEHRTILNPPEQKPGRPLKQTSISFAPADGKRGFHTLILYRPEEEFAFRPPVEQICEERILDIHGYRPPEPVTGLEVERAGVTDLTLAWDGPKEGEQTLHYEVYRDGVRTGITGQRRYKDRELAPGTTYAYTVYAKTTHSQYLSLFERSYYIG